jgi:hypothetical protein
LEKEGWLLEQKVQIMKSTSNRTAQGSLHSLWHFEQKLTTQSCRGEGTGPMFERRLVPGTGPRAHVTAF